jgi:hypothetical protein
MRPPTLFERAEEEQKKVTYKGLASTRNLNEDRDFIGAVGQLFVIDEMRSWGFEPKHSDYFDPKRSGDECDLEWRYEKIDVKTSPLTNNYNKIFPNSRFLVKDESMYKKVDRYVFVKVNMETEEVVIAGCIDYNRFWRIAEPMTGKLDCHYVLARQLADFKKFVYA